LLKAWNVNLPDAIDIAIAGGRTNHESPAFKVQIP
jgi:hypothetical protein